MQLRRDREEDSRTWLLPKNPLSQHGNSPSKCSSASHLVSKQTIVLVCRSRLCATRYDLNRESINMMMDNTVPKKANDPELDHWLNLKTRCFGDKGDVEDITEG